jgi:hypothetical protein
VGFNDAFVDLIERFLSVAVLAPIGRRFLESDEALALREPLAALLKFGNAVCKQKCGAPACGGSNPLFLKASANSYGAASGSRSAGALPDSRKRLPIGTKIAIDKNLLFQKTSHAHQQTNNGGESEQNTIAPDIKSRKLKDFLKLFE